MEVTPVVEVAVANPMLIDPSKTVTIYSLAELIALDIVFGLNSGNTTKEAN